jgi:hypothetical protein
MVPEQLNDDEKHYLKWLVIGAFVASGVGALCDLAKTELAGYLQRRRENAKGTNT